jgi:hypothetical protein
VHNDLPLRREYGISYDHIQVWRANEMQGQAPIVQVQATSIVQVDQTARFLKLSTAIKASDRKAIESTMKEDKQLFLAVDANKNNVLHLAGQYCLDDKAEILALLIAHLNELQSMQVACAVNSSGQTPLHLVVRYNSWTALNKIILALDKDINTVARMCDNLGTLPWISLLERHHGSVSVSGADAVGVLRDATYSNPFKYKLTDKVSIDEVVNQYKSGSETLVSGLKFACDLVNKVRDLITESATHPDLHSYPKDVQIKMSEKIANIRKSDPFFYAQSSPQYQQYVDILKANKAACCIEMVLLGLSLMSKNPQKMKGEFFILEGRTNNNHSHDFIVINRVLGSDPADPLTWGSDAVICDAWSGNVYPASEFATRLTCHFPYEITTNDPDYRRMNIISLYNPEFHRFICVDHATVNGGYVSKDQKKSSNASVGFFSAKPTHGSVKPDNTHNVPPQIQVWSAMHENKKSYSHRFEELKLSEDEKVKYKEGINKLLDPFTKKVIDIPVIYSRVLYDFNSLSAEKKSLVTVAKDYRDLFEQFVTKVESQRRPMMSFGK